MKRKSMWINAALVGIIAIALVGWSLTRADQLTESDTFMNPILPDGADPFLYEHEGSYVYTQTTGSNVTLWRTDAPTELATAESKVIWQPTKGERDIWAPEIHFVNDRWYVYYAAVMPGEVHKMYVLESATADPFSDYTEKGVIEDPSGKWAIDGTILKNGDDLYYVWSGWEGDVNVSQYLYIAEMSDPMTISSERVELSRPTYDWESLGAPPSINEGPQILMKEDQIHIVYSASGSWTDFYQLGLLSAASDADLMDPNAWTKQEEPVFSSNEDVFGPGHASFVTSPDGTEDWIVYHAARAEGSGWTRNVRMQPFTWEDNVPVFGEPVSTDEALPLPSGQTGTLAVELNESMTPDSPVKLRLDIPESGRYHVVLYVENQTEVPYTLSYDEKSLRGMALANDGNVPTQNIVVFDALAFDSGSASIEIMAELESKINSIELRYAN
ncbi:MULTISPECIES: glycoside hydrolase family 43 protein [Exiguobacterium]|uniref:glycoside hydrolase family 43 protein n=1 Tax=Exiguobacterium TaxID=33986 RepID=UPI001BEC0768|nr:MULTISPECIES: glycoside hydrolase family 43 protein [Exiguobacterium]MCT4777089.1 glycoside hydrolase family 43 protein [Exiguobacterium aquaticum]MCT4789851.1 glycoside hydrolase family 43 protein [Exiguobacterium mexicanum]